jgi:gluconolactonase
MHRFSIALIAAFLLAAGAPAGSAATEAEVAAIVAFTEGPTVDAAGNVYFTYSENNRILKLSTDGKVSTFRQPSNRANGLVFDPQWRLIACEAGDKAAGTPPRVTRTDMATGRVDVLAERYQGKPFTAPNDVTFDDRGHLYFSDLPGGAVYRIDPDGKLARILNRPEISSPNGLTVSPDGRTFYLVEANQSAKGPRMLRAYDLHPDGTVSNMRVFHNFFPGRSADGMTIDSDGNVYAAAGLNHLRGTPETLDTKAGIHVFSPAGKEIDFIAIPEDTLTNCAFGGPDLKTLYVTAGKTLFRFRTKVAGTHR